MSLMRVAKKEGRTERGLEQKHGTPYRVAHRTPKNQDHNIMICFRHGVRAPGLLTASVRPVYLTLPGVGLLHLWHIQTHLHWWVRSQVHRQEPKERPHLVYVAFCVQVHSL